MDVESSGGSLLSPGSSKKVCIAPVCIRGMHLLHAWKVPMKGVLLVWICSKYIAVLLNAKLATSEDYICQRDGQR